MFRILILNSHYKIDKLYRASIQNTVVELFLLEIKFNIKNSNKTVGKILLEKNSNRKNSNSREGTLLPSSFSQHIIFGLDAHNLNFVHINASRAAVKITIAVPFPLSGYEGCRSNQLLTRHFAPYFYKKAVLLANKKPLKSFQGFQGLKMKEAATKKQ